MTESEAIELLNSFYEMDEMYDAAQVAIQALEEVQPYRAIGTVEEIQQKLAELDRWHTRNKMKFSISCASIMRGTGEDVLKRHETLKKYNPQIVDKELYITINTLDEFIKFKNELGYSIILEEDDDNSLVIYDDYIE